MLNLQNQTIKLSPNSNGQYFTLYDIEKGTSSNIFGKVGDWLGNIFIFDSIGIAAFIVAFLMMVLGFQILKKNY